KKTEQQFLDWETYSIKVEDFKKYLAKKKTFDYEGIWETEPYKIGIKKEGDKYIGFIIESGAETCTIGQVKLKFSIKDNKSNHVFYMRDHSASESELVTLIGNIHLQIGTFSLARLYHKISDDPKSERYFKSINPHTPSIEL